jgi:hypothetical protein
VRSLKSHLIFDSSLDHSIPSFNSLRKDTSYWLRFSGEDWYRSVINRRGIGSG